MKIGIIGGGAAGMMAALTAAEHGEHRVLLFERQARLGKKLSATGNGRCNLSNWHTDLSHYHGSSPSFVLPALDLFPVKDTLHYFHGLGLLTTEELDGRIYPYTDQANSVLDVLRFALQKPNIQIHTGCEVEKVKKNSKGFLLITSQGEFQVAKLIVTAGGAAGSKLGGSLSGYQLLRSLGHHCTKLYPALVQVATSDPYVKSLKGIRANANIQLIKGKVCLARSSGEVQFTDYGVSGPAVFEISRAASVGGEGLSVHFDLLPQLSEDQLLSTLCIRISQFPDLLCEELLVGILHNRLGRVLLKYCGIKGSLPLSQLSWKELMALVASVHDFALPVSGVLGMDSAQVTVGGIQTEEFYPQSLESRIVPGLYAAGEVLDIDGDCGGYNLQWAWSSGHLAGKLR